MMALSGGAKEISLRWAVVGRVGREGRDDSVPEVVWAGIRWCIVNGKDQM